MSSLRETQEFFAARAAGWEQRFPHDGPAYAEAVKALAPPSGGRVLDAGCGTGRAIPFLRDAVDPRGTVVAFDVTPEMLAEVRRLGRAQLAHLVVADGEELPLSGRFDAIFAAGFLPHLHNVHRGLRELFRITRGGSRLAVFHPISRAALAARHGGVPADDDVLSPSRLPGLLDAAGWRLDSLDDGQDRYLALATRH